jgi:transposase
MEGESFLNNDEQTVLEEFHRACLDKRTADRIKTILLINKGFTYKQIEEILLLDERTINRYKNLYKNEGIDGLVANNYQGARYKLSDEQIDILKRELNEDIYANSEAICDFIWKRFKVKYTPQGMVQTLHRLGFSYKKAAAVPGKLNEEEQKKFVKRYKRRFLKQKEGEKVYFMDGCHPTFCNRIGYGWIEQGKSFQIKTTDGRKRLNLLGAYNPKDAEPLVREYHTLNAETTKEFLVELRRQNNDVKLYVICDNVPYQHSKIVKAAAKELNIHLLYLPPYSPNLNLIERYWGFLKRKVLTNVYFDSFEVFRKKILTFAQDRSYSLRNELKAYIPEKFHLLNLRTT